jgi:hypothetical protein
MKTLNELIQFHKGGGGGAAQPVQTTLTSAPPPPTTQSVEVQQAQRDAAKQAAKRRGMNQTVLAGETGGFKAPLGGGSTVLQGAQKQTTLGA